MKHFYFITICIFFCQIILSQNVGIGTATPAEKLDVEGNLKITGEIKPNGNSGQSGQVLTSDGSGAMSWANPGDYKNLITFTDTSQQYIYWQVPAGVTKVWIEAWGGGGAGFHAGGGGGGYLSILFTTTPGSQFAFGIGKGGRDIPSVFPQFTTTESGGGTRIDYAGQYYIAYGGGGAILNTVLGYPKEIPGEGGIYLTSVPATTSPRGSFYFQKGQAGGVFRTDYNSLTTDRYYQNRHYGYGGAAANTGSYTAGGAYAQYLTIVSTAYTGLVNYSTSTSGVFPGGGGGGGEGISNDGRSGANGLLIVHY